MNVSAVVVVVLDAISKPTIERYLRTGSAHLPNLTRLGLGNLLDLEFRSRFAPVEPDIAFTCTPGSTWADSVMGHRELLGFIDPTNYDLFRSGFPPDYISELSRRVGRPVLFNQRCGGDDAIRLNNEEHVRTGGSVIAYASMCDPIAQFAAWENLVDPNELAQIGRIAFDLSQDMGIKITRTISRPYEIKDGRFVRTKRRRDAVIKLPEGVELLVDVARSHGIYTVSVGKCADVANTIWDADQTLADKLPDDYRIFGQKDDKNPFSLYEAVTVLSEASRIDRPVFLMVNFPDTDSVYGHNRNVPGVLRSLEAFDRAIPLIEAALPPHSLFMITGDHGMYDGGDYGYHGREELFVVGGGKGFRADELGIPEKRDSYAAVGQLVARAFGFDKEYIERCRLETVLR